MNEAIRQTEQAAAYGANAALVVTPYYIKPNRSGLIEYFYKLADIMPTIIYDIKGRTGRQIEIDEFQELAQHENIIGVKAASGDIDQIKTLIKEVAMPLRQKGRNFNVWSGDDKLTAPVINAGGNGVISVVSNLLPDLIHYMATTMDSDRAGALAKESEPLITAAFTENNPVAIKHMMYYANLIDSNEVRLPLGQMSPENKAAVEAVVRQYFQKTRW